MISTQRSGGSGKPGPGFARNWNSSDSRKTSQRKSRSRIPATDRPTTLPPQPSDDPFTLSPTRKRIVTMADLGKRIADNIARRPSLYNIIKPFASWYSNAAGYRQVGLR